MADSKKIFQAAVPLLLGIFCLAAWPGPSGSQEDAPKPGGSIRIREDGVPLPPNLDPAIQSWVFVTEQLFEGLVRLNAKLEPVPGLADYWYVSEDGLRMTFILKRGVRFHNGREMDSGDVKFSFERLLRRETESPYAPLFTAKVAGAQEFREGRADEVSGFRASDKYTFEIQWKNPYVSALYLLSMSFCKILPRDLVPEQGSSFFAKPVGTGPYAFGYWLRSPKLDIVGVHLERNPRYHDKRPYLDVIEFSPYYSVDQFREGDVDIMPYLSDRLAAFGAQLVQGGLFNMSFLLMSCQNPPFENVVVRRAVAAAIDKGRLAGVLGGPDSALRTSANFIPPSLPGFFPLDVRLTADSERARQLLNDLGYQIEKKFPEVDLFLTLPRSEAAIRLGREIKSQLEAVGIPVNVRFIVSMAELRDVKRPYLAFFTWRMDFPDAESLIQPLFTSSAELNRTTLRYSSSAVDRLFEEAEVEKSWARRTDLFRHIEALLGEDVPAVPLFFSEERLAVKNRLRGVKVPLLGFEYLDARQIWLDKKGPQP